MVKDCCKRAGLDHIAPHDLRRTCAKLCHSSGGELEQIQFQASEKSASRIPSRSMLTFFRIPFLLLIVIQVSIAQSVSRAYVGQDGNAHLVFTNGTGKTMPREPEQLGCEGIAVSADRKVVAWSVLVKNCCTSYPIPTSVVAYRNGKTFTVSTGQMIWQWHFVGNNQLALLSGPVHGWASTANLYSVHTGKIVESWNGKGDAPDWAKSWENEFEQ